MFVEDGIDTRSLGCARKDRVGGFRGRPGRCLVIWLAKRVFRDDYARDTFCLCGLSFRRGKDGRRARKESNWTKITKAPFCLRSWRAVSRN